MGDGTRLARAGPGEDADRPRGGGHRPTLIGVETGEHTFGCHNRESWHPRPTFPGMAYRRVMSAKGIRPMLTMYSTPWCGYCHRLKSQFDREGIGYEVVDIEQDPAAAEFVMSVNGGNQTVPTIRIVPADGGAEIVMTNPSIVQVKAALARRRRG
nr:hypothetical protein GCM10020092_013190 [Actinoplanes digitatis]